MEVTLTEVAPRDGLQNEGHPVTTAQKIELIERIARAGMRRFEATSFVSPRAVPNMADAEEVVKAARQVPDLFLEALVPNLRGAERAAGLGLDEWVCFVSASESHSQANSNAETRVALRVARRATVDAARSTSAETRSLRFGRPDAAVALGGGARELLVAPLALAQEPPVLGELRAARVHGEPQQRAGVRHYDLLARTNGAKRV